MNKSPTTQDVFQTDFNRALCARFAPSEKRQGLVQFCALDAELAKIPHQTSDPLLQRIRTQFWRDALFAQEGAGHQLASEMVTTFKADHPLFETLEDLIIAHEHYQGLEGTSTSSWELYCKRQSVLFKLATTYLGEGSDQMDQSFYEQCGTAYGGAHFLCVNNSQSLKNNEEKENVYQQAMSAYAAVIADLASLVPSVRAAVLPLALVPPYLNLFQTSDKVQAQPIDLHSARKTWILWRAARKGFG